MKVTLPKFDDQQVVNQVLFAAGALKAQQLADEQKTLETRISNLRDEVRCKEAAISRYKKLLRRLAAWRGEAANAFESPALGELQAEAELLLKPARERKAVTHEGEC